MKTKIWYGIGVMSGTSLDGVDIAYIKYSLQLINNVERWTFDIISADTYAYSSTWLTKLKEAFYFDKNQLDALDIDYGNYLAKLINTFIKTHHITDVHFIASHGHTIHHQPEKGYTLQIGHGDIIAQKTNITTIYDFRSQDVALGGQGAPLVPIGDRLLFNDYPYCLNLGGFANISFEHHTERKAYDICAVNTVLNFYANKLGMKYDDKGQVASKGQINNTLLKELNALEFYKTDAPKSLGIEYVNDVVLPIIESYNLSIPDVLSTFVEHIAFQIAQNMTTNGKLLITGGGAFNNYLIERIKHFSNNTVIIPDQTIIDYKEALIFGFLGVLRLEHKINCLKSVTGAVKNHSSGQVVFIN